MHRIIAVAVNTFREAVRDRDDPFGDYGSRAGAGRNTGAKPKPKSKRS